MRTSSTNFMAGGTPRKRRTPRTVWPAAPSRARPCEALGLGDDRDDFAIAARPGVLHLAVHEREQREVLAHADVGAGVDERAALADEDPAGRDLLGAVDLHATVLPGGVAPV